MVHQELQATAFVDVLIQNMHPSHLFSPQVLRDTVFYPRPIQYLDGIGVQNCHNQVGELNTYARRIADTIYKLKEDENEKNRSFFFVMHIFIGTPPTPTPRDSRSTELRLIDIDRLEETHTLHTLPSTLPYPVKMMCAIKTYIIKSAASTSYRNENSQVRT